MTGLADKPDSAAASAPEKRDLLAIVLLMAAGLASFAWKLGADGLWHDEAVSWRISRDWSTMWAALLGHEANMWLYYIGLHGWIRLFGESPAALRSLSVLAALACIPLVYETARRLLSRRAAVTAGVLLITHVMMIRYAQEARSYAWVALAGAGSTFLFGEMVFANRRRLWPLYAVVTAAGVWLHFHLVFLPMGHYLYLLGSNAWRTSWKTWLGAGLLIGALLLPIPVLQPLDSGQVNYLVKPELDEVFRLLRLLSGGAPGNAVLAGTVLALGLAAWFRYRADRRAGTGGKGRPLLFLLATFSAIPVVFLFSIFVKPLWTFNYFLFLVPAACVLLAGLLDWLLPARRLFLAGAGLLVGLFVFVSVQNPLRRTESPLNRVVLHIARNAQAGDGVLVEKFWRNTPYFYAASRIPRMPPAARSKEGEPITYRWIESATERQIAKLPGRHPRLWVVVWRKNSPAEWAVINRVLGRLEQVYRRTPPVNLGTARLLLLEAKGAGPVKAGPDNGSPSPGPS
jgi:mannosyltransferase